jgi:hypothetical protein
MAQWSGEKENQQVRGQGASCNANLLKKPEFFGRRHVRPSLNGIVKWSSFDVKR